MVVSNAIPVVKKTTEDGTPLARICMAAAERMPWLHANFDPERRATGFEIWPALLTPTTNSVGTTVGPFGDTDLDLGYFFDSADRRGVRVFYASYVAEPANLDESGRAAIGDGLVVQFFSGGILHTWRGAPAANVPPGHPTALQQEAIDELVATLAADPGYRKLTRKSDREGYARTSGTGEIAEVVRGEHPVVPPNFGYRILRDAHATVEHGAREAYAEVEQDEPDLITALRDDLDYTALYDRTARRHHIRESLFDRYHYAPPTALVSRMLDATENGRGRR